VSAAGGGAWPLPLAIALLAVVLAIQIEQARPPAPLGSDADPALFSAERARTELEGLLGDEAPHPVGSAANRAVKGRLVARLEALGLSVETQNAVGCSARYPTCARVENVLARLPGESADVIALMAHYDSVEHAPGAGDDGAAVAALLEIARIVGSGAPYRNAILFVFTDAEEVGLLGAEAFFAEHPDAAHVKAVMNLEGSGSSGPVYLLRTGPDSGHLLDVFRAVAPAPFAQSFAEEVFKRMPNDTDFSVSMRAGLPGIDFAFAGERNHYHTPLDSIANLDLGSLQHHGENTLPLLRGLLDANLGTTAPGYVYANLGKRLWLRWWPSTGVPLAVAAVLLLAFATWRVRPRPLAFLGTTGAALAFVMAATLATLGALWCIDRIVGVRPAWPADPWPWRLPIYAVPLLLVALAGPLLVRRLGAWTVYLGVWWIVTLAALAMAIALPLAAYLLIPAALAGSALAAIGAARSRQSAIVGVAVVACIGAFVAAWFLLALAWSMENTQGFLLAPAASIPVALVALTLLPAAIGDPGRAVAFGASGALLLAFAMAALVEPYSAWRPQHLNLIAARDVDAASASLVAWAPEPIPDALRARGAFELRERAIPWFDEATQTTDVAPWPSTAPTIEPLESAGGYVRYRITPVPGCHSVALFLPRARIQDTVRVDGRTIEIAPNRWERSHRRIAFYAPPADGFVVEVKTVGEVRQPAWLVDVRTTLPDAAAPFATARGDLAVPVHTGDQTLVWRKVSI
jgi:hypothetical protein